MIIIFTLIAACVLVVLRLIARVYNENRKNAKKIKHDHDKNVKATFLEPDDIPEQDLDLFECQQPHIEYRAGCN